MIAKGNVFRIKEFEDVKNALKTRLFYMYKPSWAVSTEVETIDIPEIGIAVRKNEADKIPDSFISLKEAREIYEIVSNLKQGQALIVMETWLARKKGLSERTVGEIVNKTNKAIKVRADIKISEGMVLKGTEAWVPLSQIEMYKKLI